MTSQPGSSIRFQCSSCGGQVKVPPRQAGQACRCPKCDAELTAPQADGGGGKTSSWDDDDFFGDSLPSAPPGPTSVPKKPLEEITSAPSAPATPPPIPAANPPASPPSAPPPAETEPKATPSLSGTFEIECDLCGALLRAKPAHIGQTLPCPTCHSKIIVTDPAAAASENAMPIDLLPDLDPTAAKQQEPEQKPKESWPPEEFGVECQLCHSMVYAKRSQIGMKLKCQDCYSEVLVTKPKRRPSAGERARSDDDGFEFKLSEPDERPNTTYLATKDLAESVHAANAATPPRPSETEQSSTMPPTSSSAPVMEQQANHYMDRARQEIEEKEEGTDPPPEKPFTTGIVSFLFDLDAGIRWSGLMIFGFVVISLMSIAILSEDMHPLFKLLLILVLTPITLIYLDCAAVCFLAIVQDTSSGFDKVRNWPGMNFLDWMFDGLYIINCLWISSLLGILAGVFVGCLPPIAALLLGMISMGLLFPVLFMSVLEQESPLGMASPKVWRSLRSQSALWGQFYLRSLAMVAAGAIALGLCFSIPWALVQAPCVALMVALSFVYFRLLGRLAWCLGQAEE